MKLELHDANVNDPVTGKMTAPTHAGTVTVDYEYQAEQWVIDIERDEPDIVRCVLDSGRREWTRIDGKFVERDGPRTIAEQDAACFFTGASPTGSDGR